MARQRRQTDWHGQGIRNETMTQDSSGFITVISAAELDKYSNPTVVRCVGKVFQGISRHTSAQNDHSSVVYLGLAVVHSELSGGRDIVNSLSDDDWMWIGLHIAGMTKADIMGASDGGGGQQVATGVGSRHLPYAPVEFDVRAMRRCPDPLELRLYWQQFSDGAALDTDPTLEGFVRALVKE